MIPSTTPFASSGTCHPCYHPWDRNARLPGIVQGHLESYFRVTKSKTTSRACSLAPNGSSVVPASFLSQML